MANEADKAAKAKAILGIIEPPKNQKIDKYEIRDLILENNYIKTIIESGEFCMYKDGRYERDQKRTIETIIADTLEILGFTFNSTISNDILKLIANATYVSIKEFDKDPYLLNLNNGLYHVKDTTFKPHSPEVLSFRRIPVNYEPSQIPMVSEVFLKDVFNEEDIDLIYEFMGLCLTTETRFQKAFMFYGTGNNGKTTFFSLVASLVGIDNCSDVDLSELHQRFKGAQMEGKSLNFHSDISINTKFEITYFKKYVGNEIIIMIERKFKEPYPSKPTAKLAYSCNTTFPTIPKETDKGFWRKWITIECPNEFDKKEDINILDSITHPNELSGLLNKAIEGLQRLAKRGRFESKYDNWRNVKDLWFLKINDFATFIEQKAIQVDPKCSTEKEYTVKMFNAWLIEQGKKMVSKTKVTQLVNESPNFKHDRKKKIYYGFKLKEEEKDPQQKINVERLFIK